MRYQQTEDSERGWGRSVFPGLCRLSQAIGRVIDGFINILRSPRMCCSVGPNRWHDLNDSDHREAAARNQTRLVLRVRQNFSPFGQLLSYSSWYICKSLPFSKTVREHERTCNSMGQKSPSELTTNELGRRTCLTRDQRSSELP